MASGVQITGLIKPLNNGSFPVFEDTDGLGGWRAVPNVAARDAIPANYRKIGMVVVDQSQDPSVAYQLVGGILNVNWQLLSGEFYQFWQDSDGDLPQRRAVHPDTTQFTLTDDAGGNATRFALAPKSQNLFIVANLADLAALSNYPDGASVYVLDQGESYRLDATNTFLASSPLIISATGGGRWFKRSKAYVVSNFFLWCCITSGFTTNDAVVLGYGPGALSAGGVSAEITLDLNAQVTTDSARVNAAIVDTQGNLWVAAYGFPHAPGNSFVYKLALADCLVSGVVTPKVVIKTTTANTGIQALAFDSQSNLWEIIFGAGGVTGVLLNKVQATAYNNSASPVCDVVIQADNSVVNEFQEGLFDGFGNLWCSSVANLGAAAGGIQMISAQQLAAGSDTLLAPALVWKGSNFDAPLGMAFGPTGLLWVANYNSGGGTSRLRAYTPQNAVSGNPAPVISITVTGFNGISAVCFDSSGNAWVIAQDDSKLAFLTKAQLAVTGAVVPTKSLNMPAAFFGQTLTFPLNPSRSGPVPSGVPVQP